MVSRGGVRGPVYWRRRLHVVSVARGPSTSTMSSRWREGEPTRAITCKVSAPDAMVVRPRARMVDSVILGSLYGRKVDGGMGEAR